jgi:hypothetical protein
MTDPVSTPPSVLAAAGQDRIKKPWAMPALARMNSSDAEIGANPANPEGVLATGS